MKNIMYWIIILSTLAICATIGNFLPTPLKYPWGWIAGYVVFPFNKFLYNKYLT
jgi:hypothetical protein